MADDYESLGKASLEVEANLGEFERNMEEARGSTGFLQRALEAIIVIAGAAKDALGDVRMGPGQAAESRGSASAILEGVRHISEESLAAAHELDRVKLTEEQAAESEVSGSLITRILDRITRKSNEARRSLESVRLVGGVPGRSGVGVGPFGSGFGRIGLLGTAVAGGALLAPAAGPGALGLLAAIPALAFGAAGALGALALAGAGVGKAIKGDKAAFDELGPSAQKFVLTVRSLDGWFEKLKQTAGAGLFPGLSAGLHSALSPGTVGVLTHAVGELSRALGGAFAQWGRYFGSPQFQALFGPLMHAAAHDIGLLSTAVLYLFDAFGVLGRAAIPFTTWLLTATARGARFASTWLRAKEASGALAHGIDEAKTSLRLVAGLFVSLLRVVGALGHALYPVAKVAVKALTNGLNALAGIIEHNKGVIRSIVSVLLTGLVTAVQGAVGAVRLLRVGLSHIVGDKARIITAIVLIGAVLAATLGPYAAVIVGAIAAVGLIRRHWRKLATFFVTLGLEIANAFKWLWVQIQRGALRAALGVVRAFDFKILGHRIIPGVHRLVQGMQAALDRLHAPNMDWSAASYRAGLITGEAWVGGYTAAVNAALDKRRAHGGVVLRRGGLYVPPPKGKDKAKPDEPKPGTHAWYMKNLGYDPTEDAGSPFGEPPPFKDKKKGRGHGRGSAIPGPVQHLEALAAQEASMAAGARSAREKRKHLEREIADLQKADRLLHEKYLHAHGRAKEQLFREITRVENGIRRAHEQIRKAIAKARRQADSNREAELRLAVDRARLAVENAKEGTAAYDRAVKAEEKALRAEIAFYDKRSHNAKLSAAARDRALRAEIAAKHKLAALEGKTAAPGGAAISEFLSSFARIQSEFAPNAFPVETAAAGAHAGKTNTHLHDLVHEQRQTNALLRQLVAKHAFPATGYAVESAGAVA